MKVSANDPLEAAELATAAFKGEIQNADISKLHVTQPVRDLGLVVREDRF